MWWLGRQKNSVSQQIIFITNFFVSGRMALSQRMERKNKIQKHSQKDFQHLSSSLENTPPPFSVLQKQRGSFVDIYL